MNNKRAYVHHSNQMWEYAAGLIPRPSRSSKCRHGQHPQCRGWLNHDGGRIPCECACHTLPGEEGTKG